MLNEHLNQKYTILPLSTVSSLALAKVDNLVLTKVCDARVCFDD